MINRGCGGTVYTTDLKSVGESHGGSSPPTPTNKDIMKTLIAWIVGGAIIIVLMLPLIYFSAWVLRTIWNWYLPGFGGLPEMTMTSSLGLMFVIGYFKARIKANIFKEKDPIKAFEEIQQLTTWLIALLLVLLIAYIFKFWVL